MKRSILQGICLSASVFLLLSLDGRAAETVTKETQSVASEELMTAGVENLFISTLSVDEYKALAEQAKGAMWGYTNLGLCNVQENNLNIREQPDTGADVVTQVAEGEELQVAELYNDQWVKVFLDDEEVFVSRDYVELKSDLQTAITMTELLYGQGVSDVRVDLCQYAKQFLGNPYVWGGTSLTSGADCSGFVLSVFNKYGVTLPHSSQAQSKMGSTISASELKAGDLIFYAKGGSINHVAIYIGGGQVIHASNPKTGIRISNYNYRTPAKMVRILQD